MVSDVFEISSVAVPGAVSHVSLELISEVFAVL